jgi:hypothetical protein
MRSIIMATALLVSQADAHAYLSVPMSRKGARDGATEAAKYRFNAGYGVNNQYPYSPATLNTCPGDSLGSLPTVVGYKAGETIQVSWKLTLGHAPASVDTENVRVQYKCLDTPNDNYNDHTLYLLANGASNDPSGSKNNANGATISAAVTIPSNLAQCEHGSLQWSWASTVDGGGYIDCADVRICSAGVDECAHGTGTAPPTSTTAAPTKSTGEDQDPEAAAADVALASGAVIVASALLGILQP